MQLEKKQHPGHPTGRVMIGCNRAGILIASLASLVFPLFRFKRNHSVFGLAPEGTQLVRLRLNVENNCKG